MVLTSCLFVSRFNVPVNNFSVMSGGSLTASLVLASTLWSKCVLLNDTTQWRKWGLHPRPLDSESDALPLCRHVPQAVFEVVHDDGNIFR